MRTGRNELLAVLAFSMAALAAGHAAAAEAGFARHPVSLSLAPKPAGVPSDYLRTRHGFFHPSCVITLQSDEVWGNDLVIRGLDGSVHERMAPCAYPRYGLDGGVVAQPGATPSLTLPHKGQSDVYDGWILDYFFAGKVPANAVLSTDWIVPLPPANVGGQDIAFFNSIETRNLILQPVLDFSELPGKWAIESENCCASNNDIQSKLVEVSPGDQIRGVVTLADCGTDGVCTNWTVTTTDVTTGKSTVLNMQNPNEAANEVNPGVLETYNITSCDMFPANGEITFTGNMVTAGGQLQPMAYELDKIPTKWPAGFPTDCGYRASTSGGSYTLFFATSPAPVAGGDGGTVAPAADAGVAADSAPVAPGVTPDAAAGGSPGIAPGGSGGAGGSIGGAGGAGLPSVADASAGGVTPTGGEPADAGGVHARHSGGCSYGDANADGAAVLFALAALASLLVARRPARARRRS